jgi:hypothetical protein
MVAIRIAIVTAIFTLGSMAAASALSERNLIGKWCGDGYSYTFTHTELTVQFTNNTPTRRFKIVDYAVDEDGIIMRVEYISDKGKQVHTDFNEFSEDGRFMAQQKSGVGPRRTFRRCN